MKQTLLLVRRAYQEAALVGGEPTPAELGRIIEGGIPADQDGRRRYFCGMGVFIGQALQGLVIDPENWDS